MSELHTLLEGSLTHAITLLEAMSLTGQDASLRREVAHELQTSRSRLRLLHHQHLSTLARRAPPAPCPARFGLGSAQPVLFTNSNSPPRPSRPGRAPPRPILFPNSSIPVLRHHRTPEQHTAFLRMISGGTAGTPHTSPDPVPPAPLEAGDLDPDSDKENAPPEPVTNHVVSPGP